jgi:hypothetical protein
VTSQYVVRTDLPRRSPRGIVSGERFITRRTVMDLLFSPFIEGEGNIEILPGRG